MKKSVELKQKRAGLISAQQAILTAAEAENRSVDQLTEDEANDFDTKQREIDALNASIQRAEISEANAAVVAASAAAPVADTSLGDSEQREKRNIYARVDILKAIRSAAPGSDAPLDGAELEMHQIGEEDNRNAAVPSMATTKRHLAIPLDYLGRADQQTVVEDSGEYGGALVQNQAPRMVEPLRPVLAFEALGADFLTGLTGGNVPLVVDNDFAMAFLAEGANASIEKKKFEGPVLAPKRAAGAVVISNKLIMQSSVDVTSRVGRGLTNGFAQLLHSAAINGAGGVAPEGILNKAGVNAAADVAAANASWAKIVELMALIEEDDATSDRLGYLLHPKLKAALMQIKKDAGSGRFLLENNTISGLPYVSTSQVPVLDAGGTPVYPLIYGDFSQMVIGQWGAMNILINPYSADIADGVRLTLNTYADVAIANPAAFAKNAFLTDVVA
jgi:HK97 family phage major capsid protein